MPRRAVRMWWAVVVVPVIAGCIPPIPEDEFVHVASAWALGPEKTCRQLAREFGLPNVPAVANPAGIGLPFVEDFISVPGGGKLRAWYIPVAEPRGLVIFSNGAVGEMPCYLFIVLNLAIRGWSVAMYDFTGFGGSDGTPSLESLTRDGQVAIDWALEIAGCERAVLMGVSLGTIPAAAYAAEHPERVQALVLDGPISLRVETERFALFLGFQPARYAAQFAPPLRLEENLPRVTAPMLAILYGLDEFATARRAPALLAAVPAPVTIHTFADLPHARGPYFRAPEYFGVVEAFLTAHAVDTPAGTAP